MGKEGGSIRAGTPTSKEAGKGQRPKLKDGKERRKGKESHPGKSI
jgi:hypothetical protein